MFENKWRRLQPVGFRACENETPQAEACATRQPVPIIAWGLVRASGVSGGRSGAHWHFIACTRRSFVYWSRIDFYGMNFLPELAAIRFCESAIRSKRLTGGGHADEQRTRLERQGGFP